MTVKTSKKLPFVHIWVNSQNDKLTDFDPYSYLPLKFSYSRRVQYSNCAMYVYVSYIYFRTVTLFCDGNCTLSDHDPR